MQIQIRPAMSADLPAILQIYAPYVLDTAISFEYEIPTLDEFTLRFDAVTAQFPWLVCEYNDQIAGYAYASPAFVRAAYQWNVDISVYVAPPYQRRGIASAFYHSIEHCLYLQGYCSLYAVVTASNQQSTRFHETLGFCEVGRFHSCGYKLDIWHDVVWYEKCLQLPEAKPLPPIPFTRLSEETIAVLLHESSSQIK